MTRRIAHPVACVEGVGTMRAFLSLIAVCLFILISCGDPSGPQAEYPTPSVLFVEFTGETDLREGRSSTQTLCSSQRQDLSPREAGLRTEVDRGRGICIVTAEWTECNDDDFERYELFRSESPGIQSDPSEATLLVTFTSSSQLTFDDAEAEWETTYFYAIRTTNSSDLSSWSNEASITTPSGSDAPTPSVLTVDLVGRGDRGTRARRLTGTTTRSAPVGEKGTCQVAAAWTSCPDADFSSYTLYRSETPGISQDTTSAVNLGSFTSSTDTCFVDGEAACETAYYYALMTMDTEGLSSWSNEDSVTTPSAPTPSVLAVVFSGGTLGEPVEIPVGHSHGMSLLLSASRDACQVTATWTACPDADFSSYTLYRSLVPGIPEDTAYAVNLGSLTSPGDTIFIDTGVTWETTYYYALLTRNDQGCSSWSNEASVATPSQFFPPTPSVLSVEFTGATGTGRSTCSIPFSSRRIPVLDVGRGTCEFTATWTQCPDYDFLCYTLFRSYEPYISQDTSLAVNLGTFYSPSDTGFVDAGAEWGDSYYYALRTRDTEGYSSWSNECCVATIAVTQPDSTTIWQYQQAGTTVSWEGGATDSVRIEIWQGGSKVGDYAGWVPNTGSYTRTDPLDPLWTAGTDYTIRVIDQDDNIGISGSFIISGTIVVTQPGAGTVWEIGQTDTQAAWTGGGAQVKLEVWYAGSYVGDFSGWIPNTGSYVRSAPIPTDWGIGILFRIRVVDSSTPPDDGFSDQFQITTDIEVTNPVSGTIWAWGQVDNVVEWSDSFSDSVYITLYKGGSYVGDVSDGWVQNTGSYTRTEPVPESWGTGEDEYAVRVSGNYSSDGESEPFSVWAYDIIEPDSLTAWYVTQTGTQVLWVDGPGTQVRMEVWFAGSKVGDYCGWTPDDGEYTRPEEIPSSWGTGFDCQIRMIDDLDNEAFSQLFPLCSAFPDSMVGTIPVGSSNGLCSLPSGEYVYVANTPSNTVSVILTSDDTVTSTISGFASPWDACSLPSGEYVYVTNYGGNSVSVIRTSDNTIVAEVPVGPSPACLCTLPSGEYVYAANRYGGSVSVIRTSDNTVVATVSSVGGEPIDVCSVPSGEYVYVTCCSSNSVAVIRTSDNTVVATVGVGYYPLGICCHPSGEYVYVMCNGDDEVDVIRASDNTVVSTIAGTPGWGICALSSGEYVYTSDGGVICAANNTFVDLIDLGYNNIGICALPSGEKLYVACGGLVGVIE